MIRKVQRSYFNLPISTVVKVCGSSMEARAAQ